MKTTPDQAWLAANRQRLASELERIRRLIGDHRGGAAVATREIEPVEVHEAASTPVSIDVLCTLFQLSPFERDILLLCAGIELESGFASLCATAQGDARRTYPTFSLALASIPGGHWSALAPQAPLRYWRLVEMREGETLVTSRLIIDERVLHFLVGVDAVDARLDALLKDLPTVETLAPSQRLEAERLRKIWESYGQAPPVVEITGDDPLGAKAVASRACTDLGLQTMALRAEDLPAQANEREVVTRLLTRECLLRRSALVIDMGAGTGPTLDTVVDGVECPLIVIGGGGFNTKRPRTKIEVSRPLVAEQRAIWRSELGDIRLSDLDLERVTGHFNLTAAEIGDAAREAKQAMRSGMAATKAVWNACRVRARGGLDQLAQRIESDADWDNLILPQAQIQLLQEIARQVRHRPTVHERWEFTPGGPRGLGVSALFAGESGTGKTLAAEVLANELDLDLYRIDLSSVVSKYIGETEKNLKLVFDAAQASGAILLFDEADALFGKRSEVKDSHDRYANIEVGYLLQRIESYHGLAILTTNMKALLDTAFLRRIRFVVTFPFPDAGLRNEIWKRVFPPAMPVNGVEFDKLARLNVAGGNIRNIALNAAFLAAADGKPLSMGHLLHAAQVECAKIEKPLTEAEVGGWR